MFREQLEQLLLQRRRQTDLEIEKLINEHFAGRIRFSARKFTGDLGELYFHQSAGPLFSRLEESQICDRFLGWKRTTLTRQAFSPKR